MNIYLGSDHAGYVLRKKIGKYLLEKGYDVEDLGCITPESCDYSEFAVKVGKAVVKKKGSMGVVICGSGLGVSMAANKVKGIRAALCNSIELAKLAREHNGANVLALGERTKFFDDPIKILDTFLKIPENMEERHVKRRKQLDRLGGK